MADWKEENNRLSKTFTFSSFPDAIRWMQGVSDQIESLNHHPNWSNVYNRVDVELSTHDAGNIVTEKDHELAGVLDEAYSKFQ